MSRATIPLGMEVPDLGSSGHGQLLIDGLVFRKLKELGLPPSPPCSDAEFVRRSSLDICGLLPSPEEVARYEADTGTDRKIRWVESLLARPEYADFFALKWSAILRNQRGQNIFGQGSQVRSFAFHAWVREAIAENRPYDQFAADLIAARGDPATNPAVAWYRTRDFMTDPDKALKEQVDDSAQLFLGMRIQCARCHHHPFEKWSQDDYFGFASFFTRGGARSEGEDFFSPKVYVKPTGLAKHPVTGKEYKPKALDGPEFAELGPARRPARGPGLVAGVGPDNPFFAKALVNRYWKHFFGRGLVEPEDDMRVSNPPTNPELLDALADDFVKHGYDLRRPGVAHRHQPAVCPVEPAERVQRGRSGRTLPGSIPRRLPAEVLDGRPERPSPRKRPTSSWDSSKGFPQAGQCCRMRGSPPTSSKSFAARKGRESVCECERTSEANLSQRAPPAQLGRDRVKAQPRHHGHARRRWASDKDTRPDAEKVEELYRLALARRPTTEDLEVCLAHIGKHRAGKTVRKGYEDILWALLNTKEFLFNR